MSEDKTYGQKLMENLSSQPLWFSPWTAPCFVTVTTVGFRSMLWFPSCWKLIQRQLLYAQYFVSWETTLWFTKASSEYLLSQWGRVSYLNVLVIEFNISLELTWFMASYAYYRQVLTSFKRIWVIDKEWPQWKNTYWFYMILKDSYHFQQKIKF